MGSSIKAAGSKFGRKVAGGREVGCAKAVCSAAGAGHASGRRVFAPVLRQLLGKADRVDFSRSVCGVLGCAGI